MLIASPVLNEAFPFVSVIVRSNFMTGWDSEKQNVSSGGQKGLEILTLMKESTGIHVTKI